jgi:hypothetical protein
MLASRGPAQGLAVEHTDSEREGEDAKRKFQPARPCSLCTIVQAASPTPPQSLINSSSVRRQTQRDAEGFYSARPLPRAAAWLPATAPARSPAWPAGCCASCARSTEAASSTAARRFNSSWSAQHSSDTGFRQTPAQDTARMRHLTVCSLQPGWSCRPARVRASLPCFAKTLTSASATASSATAAHASADGLARAAASRAWSACDARHDTARYIHDSYIRDTYTYTIRHDTYAIHTHTRYDTIHTRYIHIHDTTRYSACDARHVVARVKP